jgi:hypothetical protein
MSNLPLLKLLTTFHNGSKCLSQCFTKLKCGWKWKNGRLCKCTSSPIPPPPPLVPQNVQLDSTPNLAIKSMLDMVSKKLCALSHATQLYLGRTSETTTKPFDRMKEHETNIWDLKACARSKTN